MPQPEASSVGGQRTSYREILVSTLLIGGSSGVNVLISLLRVKAFALLLGPAGVGLLGVLQSLADLVRSAAELGINSSGVRQIADAAASGDERRIAVTVKVLRRVALALGVLGAIATIVLAQPLSQLTFGTPERAWLVALLSIVVLVRLVSDGQAALLQGLRRVADLAQINVLGALLGTVASLLIVWVWGTDGIVPSLIAMVSLSALVSWRLSRRVEMVAQPVPPAVLVSELRGLLRLGTAFMASALLMTATAYVVRLLVLRHGTEEAAGLYQAAWSISGLYVGFVLQAMGADFYPRLVGAIDRHDECNRLVNEQTRVGLLFALPGVLGTLTLAPLALVLLYSPAFADAAGLLRWMCLGMAMRIITWPIGYIVVAKNRPALFAAVEAIWTVACVALTWLCLRWRGLDGAGIAYLGAYLLHALVLWPIVRRLTGFRWSAQNRRAVAGFLLLVGAVFAVQQTLAPLPAALIGVAVLTGSTIFSARQILQLLPPHQLPAGLRRFRPKGEALP